MHSPLLPIKQCATGSTCNNNEPKTHTRLSQEKFKRLPGCYVKSMGPIFKTELLIYQSKANLDEKILFEKITHHLDLEIRKIPVRGLYVNRIFNVPFWSMIYVALKLTW